MSAVNGGAPAGGRVVSNRRLRNRALALTSLAMAFYFGFIALTIYRSHH